MTEPPRIRPPTIDHDPDEPPPDRSKSPWGILAVALVAIWGVYLAYIPIDWSSIALGAFTAGVFVSWAIDITGNRVSASWRGKPAGPRR